MLIHEHNQTTLAEIASLPANKPESGTIIPGLQLQESAWRAFLATGLSTHVEFDFILSLSRLYALQQVYKQTGAQLSEAGMNVAAYATALGTEVDGAHYQAQFGGYFNLLVEVEGQLLKEYGATLDSLAN